METKLTVKEIQQAIVRKFGKIREKTYVPNVSWGLLPYEADLLMMNNTRLCFAEGNSRDWVRIAE